jgi:serine phosphatase RsbU (regulator of sigma subunit)
MMYVPFADGAGRHVQVLSPDGLVLGLRIDNGERFNALLEEVTVPLAPGDVLALYTDGMVEAMNGEGDWFGEARLGALLEQHAELTSDELRERILREIRDFVGPTAQHDDMTMLLMKVDS